MLAFVGDGTRKRRKPRDARAAERRRARAYHCGRCLTRVCDESAGDGRGQSFENPAGMVFVIARFDEAPGCVAEGEPTLEHTWFAGFAWQIANCRNCGAQLGWRFSDGSSAFWGLILARLVGPT